MKAFHIFCTAIGAAVAGAATALLFAPKSGEDLRGDIKKFVRKHCPFAKKNRLEAIADKIVAEIKAVAKK